MRKADRRRRLRPFGHNDVQRFEAFGDFIADAHDKAIGNDMRIIIGIVAEEHLDAREFGGKQKLFEAAHAAQLFLRFGRTAFHEMQNDERHRPYTEGDPEQGAVII